MNKQPIENARDTDLRLSPLAMRRAAQRARALAVQTGTALVVIRDGVLEHINPQPGTAGMQVQEPPASYRDER